MTQKTLSILLFLSMTAIFCSPLFYVSADNEDSPPVHSHTRFIHGKDASFGGLGGTLIGDCFTGTISIGIYYVGFETCTHGEPYPCESSYEWCTYCNSGYDPCLEYHGRDSCDGNYH